MTVRSPGPRAAKDDETTLALLVRAVDFAADRHRDQRRKDEEASPYINHPIKVANELTRVGGVTDPTILVAAILHDTIEDTETTAEDLEREFGREVRLLVEEMTDDKRLPKDERKRLQVLHASRLSPGAKQIKIADKICNVRDVAQSPPAHWDQERRRKYLVWAEHVVAGCRGVNPRLDARFDEILRQAQEALGARP